MDFAKKIESIGLSSTKFIKLSELELNAEAKVTGFKILNSQFGRQLVAITDTNSFIILPNRMCDVVQTEEHLEILNKTFGGVVFLGVQGKTNVCKLTHRDNNQSDE